MTDSERVSIDQCRDLLGSEADDSEEQIAAIRDHANAMAHLIIDMFIEQPATATERDGVGFDGVVSIPIWLAWTTRHTCCT